MSGLNNIKEDWKTITILFTISAIIAYNYYLRIFILNYDNILLLHNQILDGVADTPYRYRILVPFITEILTNIFIIFISFDKAFSLSYLVYFFGSIFLMFLLLFYYLKTFFTKAISLIGILFVAITIDVALRNHYYQPWTFLEVVFLTLSLICILKKNYFLLGLVIVLGSFNRETAVFVPVVFFFTNIDWKQPFRKKEMIVMTIMYCTLWLIVFIGLRLYFGDGVRAITISQIWQQNVNNINLAIKNIILFMGIFWVFMLKGIKESEEFLRKTTLVIPFYISSILIYGIWAEVRLLIPLYPIIIPPALAYLETYLKDDHIRNNPKLAKY